MKDQETERKQATKKRSQAAKKEIWRSFVACSRCSFFLSGYTLIHDDLDNAIANTKGKWLDLTWSKATRSLVQKSYGVSIRMTDSHFEGVCDDCRRVYIFGTSDSEPPQTTFKVKINPSP